MNRIYLLSVNATDDALLYITFLKGLIEVPARRLTLTVILNYREVLMLTQYTSNINIRETLIVFPQAVKQEQQNV